MKRMPHIIACALILVLLQSGIVPRDSEEKRHIDLANEIQFKCVGQITKVQNPCGSFVLINDSTVLSAAHNFVHFKNPKRDSSINIDLFQFKIDSIEYTGIAIKIHPFYFVDSLSTGHDLAIIRLKNKVKDIKPAEMNQNFNELNMVAVTVGYGVFIKAGVDEHGDHLKIAGRNVVDSLTCRDKNGEMSVLNCDFDGPKEYANCNKTGNSEPIDMETGLTGGDSGGGLFIIKNEKWYLVGISSNTYPYFLKSNCDDYGQLDQWARVKANYNWIISNLKM